MSGEIAIIGCGLVGRAWAMVFARAGHPVRLYDVDAAVMDAAPGLIAEGLADLKRYGLIDDPAAVLACIRTERDLSAALAGAVYAQESVFERVDVKRDIFTAIDRVVGPETLIGSSSSGIPASAFTEHVACRARCLVAHPVNPPHVIPVVELVPAPWTAPETVAAVRRLMEEVGQAPVELTREIEGFLINRLQAVLLMEAWRLAEAGYATVADLDRTLADGLGLRWSFMGPFETIDLNAPGGVADYARRLGPLYQRIAASCSEHRVWDEALIAKIEQQRRRELPADQLAQRSAWRDRRLMALALHKREMAAGDGEEKDAH
ncbi:MAG TPA: 3-hydroxyacyl-CoA dehydrogenase [Dongiaceae bacterium]|jgi:3-hydroxyacyl-CoA dehydrogenase